MEFFNEASRYLPNHWEANDYKSTTYVLVDIDKDSDEYKEIENYCTGKTLRNIKEIKRIQHPFAYLRYKLREEFQRKWGEFSLLIDENRSIEEIGDQCVEDYIKYNCDTRRKSLSSGSTQYVIKKSVNCSPTRDTNWYPEYLVKVE